MSNTFDDVRLPEDVEQGAHGGPQFQTSVVGLSGGTEQRVQNWEQTRAAWDIGYGIQDDDDFAVVEAFFYARRGKARGFRFKDWHDFICTAENIGTGNGTKRTFLFTKTYDDDVAPFVRRITRPIQSTVKVYKDAVLQVSGYTLTVAGGYIKFDVAPANGVVITFDCEFDIPVRFDVDNFDLTLFWRKAGEIPAVPVIEIRDEVNGTPTDITLINEVSSLDEDQDMTSHVRVADVVVDDDPFGEDALTLSGTDADAFELVGTLTTDGTGVSVYLRAATALTRNIVPADGTLTLDSVSNNVSNTDTVTIDGKVYTFQTSLTDVDGHVKIGASGSASLTNLVNAINVDGTNGTPGTDFATSTTAHPTVTANRQTTTTVLVTALASGSDGNAVATTESSSHLSWSGSTLSGGTDALFDVTVNLSDPTLSLAVLDSVDYHLDIDPVEGAPTVALRHLNASFAWDQDTTSRIRVADIFIQQRHPAAANNTIVLSGANASDFEIDTSSVHGTASVPLYIKAGTAGAIDADHLAQYDVTVEVSNADFSSPPQATADLSVFFGIHGDTFADDTPGSRFWVVEEYETLIIEGWGSGAGAAGTNQPGHDGATTTITTLSMVANGGKSAALLNAATGPSGAGQLSTFNTVGGLGGSATGGDDNDTGNSGKPGVYQGPTAATSVDSGDGGAAPHGGDGGVGAHAVKPANPYSGSPCSSTPPQPYPVPGTSDDEDGQDGVAPGGGGSGAAQAAWVLTLALQTGYCWTLTIMGRPGAGSGGHVKKTFIRGNPGSPVPGDHISYTVAAKGAGGLDVGSGGDGADGRFKATWF
jgi:uncharacterized protein (TIGR02217 family)